jgi:hypothetical protein
MDYQHKYLKYKQKYLESNISVWTGGTNTKLKHIYKSETW